VEERLRNRPCISLKTRVVERRMKLWEGEAILGIPPSLQAYHAMHASNTFVLSAKCNAALNFESIT